MSLTWESTFVDTAMFNGTRYGELRRKQPYYLADLPLEQSFRGTIDGWDQRFGGWKARQRKRPDRPATTGDGKTRREQLEPAGFSRALANKVLDRTAPGPQWDAEATIGTNRALRHLKGVRNPHARFEKRSSDAHLVHVSSLPALRDVGHYQVVSSTHQLYLLIDLNEFIL